MDYDDVLFDVKEMLGYATKIGVLTGAGISTDSGIPDFRGPQGIWTLNPDAEKLSTLGNYLKSKELREEAWRRDIWNLGGVEPNAGHKALVRAHEKGILLGVSTQNIDGLHQAAGLPEDKVFEIHGSYRRFECARCKRPQDETRVLQELTIGNFDPRCEEPQCNSPVKRSVIYFGEDLPKPIWDKSVAMAMKCDLFFCIGTSLGVYPANTLPDIAASMGAPVVIINAGPTDGDHLTRLLLRGSISEVLDELF